MGAELTEAVVASSAIKPTFEQVYAESLPGLVRLARVALHDASRAEEVVKTRSLFSMAATPGSRCRPPISESPS